ncbi:MAG: hypothetical protein HFH61_01915 [Lachnospiraceae bacterium]|nr:hypothetical protein [Lachnospiraceae bacterium]
MKQTVRRFFLGERSECPPGSAYFWTILSGTTYSASTFLMFWLLSRVSGPYEAGIFTIVMAAGQQLLTIGYFNVRTYQVSDVTERFSFSQYFSFRMATCAAMTFVGILWVIVGGYRGEKLAAFLWILLFKVAEAMADVMEGLYQQKDRYDVTGKCIFYETVIFLAAFGAHLLLFGNLSSALAFMCLVYIVSLLVIDRNLVGAFARMRLSWDMTALRKLFWDCLPLFINSFLMVYLNSVAKYAMDACQGEEMLSYFNMIYMPAFVMNLFAGFLFKPLLTRFSNLFHQGERKALLALLGRQLGLLLGAAFFCLGGAWLLGIPVLSWFYHTDLSAYRGELCVVVIGGVFSAVYLMLQFLIVIMRRQYACLAGCLVTSAVAAVAVPFWTRRYGMPGAAWGYMLMMALLSVIYMLMAGYYLRKWKNTEK